MPEQLLTLKVKCKDNERCEFRGRDMFLEIHINNQQQVPIGYPLAYRQKTGPSIRLIDTITRAEAQLKTNLADSALREQFTEIPPGGSVVLEWVVTSGEIQQFPEVMIDLTAEVTLKAEIRVRGALVDSTNSDSVHITGRRY